MDLQLRPERDTETASPHTVLQQAERYERFDFVNLIIYVLMLPITIGDGCNLH